jgi:AraC family transcriptional activator of pobA
MATNHPRRVKSINEYHQFMGLPKPEHPLISVIDFESIKRLPYEESISVVFDFYSISLKKNFNAKLKYGQQEYDFD